MVGAQLLLDENIVLPLCLQTRTMPCMRPTIVHQAYSVEVRVHRVHLVLETKH